MDRNEPSVDEVRAQLSERSNWGRWGPDDQRGAVNLVTAQKRIEAAALVKTGRTVSLSRDYPKTPAPNNARPSQHYIQARDTAHGGVVLTDYYGTDYHGSASTHIDALCHLADANGGWNGRNLRESVTPDGVTWGGIEHWRDGITTRGVFLDVPAHRGTPYVAGDIHGSELSEIAQEQGVDIRPGDAVVVYAGRDAYERDNGPWGAPGKARPGLHASCLWFLRESDCSVLVWDMLDSVPQIYYDKMFVTVHACIFAYGIALIDNAALENLADACRLEGRYEFMLTIAPLAVIGGTGSPVNPIALF